MRTSWRIATVLWAVAWMAGLDASAEAPKPLVHSRLEMYLGAAFVVISIVGIAVMLGRAPPDE